MLITQEQLDQAYTDYRRVYGGRKEDYFGLLWLTQHFRRSPDEVGNCVAWGGNDYGIDAFYFDEERRNLYLYQFKWTDKHAQFRGSFERLVEAGMERLFGDPLQDGAQNQVLLQAKDVLRENSAIIDRVYVDFIFNGDPEGAERSAVLTALREDLEEKQVLLQRYFAPREVSLTIRLLSNATYKLAPPAHVKRTWQYTVSYPRPLVQEAPSGELLYVGFLALEDLAHMYADMGKRLFERNIRMAIDADEAPNRSLRESLTKIVTGRDTQEIPEYFTFNHNGVTLAAERAELSVDEQQIVLTEPRVLNGAQSITTYAKLKDALHERGLAVDPTLAGRITVLAKIITRARPEFVTRVTICNNKQNPVHPWNLRASDSIQLALQDRFREELNIYYQRQEGAFREYSDSDLEELGITQRKEIEIRRLAQTLLAAQGMIDKMSRMPEVFEDDAIYRNTFREAYLQADFRRILLAYKIQFRLNRIINEVIDRGRETYDAAFRRAKNLIWALLIQGSFNAPEVGMLLEKYGSTMTVEAEFTGHLVTIGGTKVRLILSELLKGAREQELLRREKYDFLRVRAAYQKCMDIAADRYRWTRQTLGEPRANAARAQ